MYVLYMSLIVVIIIPEPSNDPFKGHGSEKVLYTFL